jgi:hypothetical protein
MMMVSISMLDEGLHSGTSSAAGPGLQALPRSGVQHHSSAG